MFLVTSVKNPNVKYNIHSMSIPVGAGNVSYSNLNSSAKSIVSLSGIPSLGGNGGIKDFHIQVYDTDEKTFEEFSMITFRKMLLTLIKNNVDIKNLFFGVTIKDSNISNTFMNYIFVDVVSVSSYRSWLKYKVSGLTLDVTNIEVQPLQFISNGVLNIPNGYEYCILEDKFDIHTVVCPDSMIGLVIWSDAMYTNIKKIYVSRFDCVATRITNTFHPIIYCRQDCEVLSLFEPMRKRLTSGYGHFNIDAFSDFKIVTPSYEYVLSPDFSLKQIKV